MDGTIGTIMAVGFNFAPQSWAKCDGSAVSVSSNAALYALIGTYFGGDGRTTFNLPDLRGRVIVGAGNGPGLTPLNVGNNGGAETVTLATNNLPVHSHTATLYAETAAGTKPNPTNRMLSAAAIYADPAPASNAAMYSESIVVQSTGSGQAFNKRDPFLAMNYIICTIGSFPSRN